MSENKTENKTKLFLKTVYTTNYLNVNVRLKAGQKKPAYWA